MSISKEANTIDNITSARAFQHARELRPTPASSFSFDDHDKGKLIRFPSPTRRRGREQLINKHKEDILLAIFDYFLSFGTTVQDAKSHLLKLGGPDTHPTYPFIHFADPKTQKAAALAVESFRYEPGNSIATSYTYLTQSPGRSNIILSNMFGGDTRSIIFLATIDNFGKPLRVSGMTFQ